MKFYYRNDYEFFKGNYYTKIRKTNKLTKLSM